MELATTLVFVATMVLALASDVRTAKIPNALVVGGLLAALVLRGSGGWEAAGAALLGAGLALVVTVPLFAIGALGGGDAKLFAVVGAFMGPRDFLLALLASAAVGGVLGVAYAVRRGVIVAVLLGCKDLLVWGLSGGRRGARVTLDSPGAVAIPYGAAIAIGSVAVWFLFVNAS